MNKDLEQPQKGGMPGGEGRSAAGKPAAEPEPVAARENTLSSHVPLLLAILIGLSLWIYLYTEFFPVFGSIVGLGGVLVVVPAMKGLMAKERQEAYASYFDQMLFQSHLTAKIYVACLLVIVFVGFVMLQPARFYNASLDRPIEVSYRSVSSNGEGGEWASVYLQPRQTKPMPLLRPVFGGPAALDVKASGLPRFRRQVSGLSWPTITLPSAAWREPVIILRPDADLMAQLNVRLPRLTLELRRAGEDALVCEESEPWFGSPIWIGGGEDTLAVPSRLATLWRNEHALASLRGTERGLSLLTSGISRRLACADIAERPVRLLPSDELHFRIVAGNGDAVSEGTITINGDEPFPMEVVAQVRSPQ
ncbi:hypothetical protein [Hoeflea prorocentri]|uniref:Uncharacterized protein n=1 Tax=Hoeflea prorocentri TaxID=1922333 RepID=A0A9X3ZI80_9HYPH|nr:hypothetical protein [Hoeflea prorocentri]MCY6381718.1 hypothetical protein [Hoeflea prorocentri]MDA5399518.1 hypothetical protein [Hoeflea prorocentri]